MAALFADVNPHSADARCPNPGPNRPDNNQYYHAGGYYQTPSTAGGVYANIQVKQPWVEPSQSDNFSSAWTMLVGPAIIPGNPPYAQVGWDEYPNSGRQNFYTWTDRYGNQAPVIYAGPAFTLNTYHYFTTLYDVNAFGKFSFYIDGGWISTRYLDWQPNEAQLSGEIDTLASQMPGGWGYPDYMNDIAVWYNGGWQRPTLNTFTSNFSYFGVWRWGSGAGQNLAIWDQYCQD